MGNAASVPEAIYAAVKSDDVATLKNLVAKLGARDQATIRESKVLEYQGTGGLTPLLVACSRGYTMCADLLLRYGANLHFIGPRPELTTALHEAVLNQRMNIVQNLLQLGADPFLENGRGLTSVDAAINTGNTGLVRMLERRSKFAAQLMLKVPRFGGLSSEWKERWVTILPRHPSPLSGDAQPVIRTLLVAYKSYDDHQPTLKLWLNGAKADFEEGHYKGVQCRLELHGQHVPPSGAHLTREGATGPWQLHFRQLDGAPGAQALNTFVQIVNDINRRAVPPRAGPRPPGASTQTLAPQPLPPTTGGVVDDAAVARRLQQEYDAEVAQYLVNHPDDTTLAHMKKFGGTTSARPSPYPAPGPPSTPPRAQPQPGSPGPLEFHSRTSPIHSFPTGNYPAIGTSATQPLPPPGAATSSAEPPQGSAPPSAPPLYPTVAPAVGAATSASAVGTGGRGSAFTPEWWESVQTAQAPPSGQAQPLASTAPGSAKLERPTTDDSEAGMCVVCLAEPANTGFTHGDSLHKCCCKDCAKLIKESNQTCPMCRQPIASVIYNFY